jgi:hypothetical protein
MRKLLPLLLALPIAACGGPSAPPPPGSDETSADASTELAAPGVSVTAAPGVAFNYRYAFRLPSERIASVQEQHAQACEKLGISRCRITGARYRVMGDREIEGMLAFKLDPAIARAFGKSGVDLVAAAEGMLVDAEINGTDAGAAIGAANRNEAALVEELREIERQLARGGIPAYERARLQQEAQSLRQQIRATRDGRTAQRESLATTPMVFHYGSGELIPGFDTRSPIRAALVQAFENFVGGVATLLVILITLLPWAALGLFGWWAVRRFRGLLPKPAAATEA